jgi:hypothetical protein
MISTYNSAYVKSNDRTRSLLLLAYSTSLSATLDDVETNGNHICNQQDANFYAVY